MQKSTELRDLTLRWMEAWSSGDFGFFERHFAQQDGLLVIGTDPEEWWVGYDTVIQVLGAQIEEMSGISIVGSDPQAYTEGTAGWAADRLTFKFPDGTEMSARFTLVFHREDGDWKFVQIHGSFGIPNEEAIGQELTT